MDPSVILAATMLCILGEKNNWLSTEMCLISLCQPQCSIASFEIYFDSGRCKDCHGNDQKHLW